MDETAYSDSIRVLECLITPGTIELIAAVAHELDLLRFDIEADVHRLLMVHVPVPTWTSLKPVAA